MLEQASAVGVVVVPGGERPPERLTSFGIGAEDCSHQRGQVPVLDGCEQRVELAFELGDRGARTVEQPVPVDIGGGLEFPYGDLEAVAGVA